jgi:hypothetical protein
VTSFSDPRLAQLASLWQVCSGLQEPSRALAENQRVLAEFLFREAEAAVQELEKTEALLQQREEQMKKPEKKRKVAVPVQELLGNPKQLHLETLDLLRAMSE